MDIIARTMNIAYWLSLSIAAIGLLLKLNNLSGADLLLNSSLPIISIVFFFRAFAKKE